MKISVIITTYNSEQFISRTIQSILNQEKKDIDFELEIIVVDDCSTDNTKSIVKQYDNIVFIENKKNSGGPNKGRNIALQKCTGDYICIVDHDDEWLPLKMSKQLKLANNSYLIVSSSYLQYDITNNTETKRGNKSSEEYIIYKENETFINKLAKNKKGEKAYIGSLMFHHSLKNILFEEKYGMVDFDWMLKIFQNNKSIEITQPLYRRYFLGSNLSLNENYRKNDYEHSLNTVSAYQDVFPKLVKKSIKRINGSMARYYYYMGNTKKARTFFLKSEYNMKNFSYYITSFICPQLIKKHFNVFG